MSELTNLISQKTGLPQDKAQDVVNVVVNYLKGKLPSNVAPLLDTAASGQTPNIGDLGKDVGGLFGKK